MKAVELLLNSFLPDDLRKNDRVLNKAGIDQLMADVARLHPDQYSEIVKKVSDVGRNASYVQGETLTLQDMRPVLDKERYFKQMDAELAAAKKTSKTPEEYQKKREIIWGQFATLLEKDTVTEGFKQHNNLGNSVVSGARGNPAQYRSMVTTPALYSDYRDRTIPLFIRRSFGEGLRPGEWLASTYGVRRSVVSTKKSTAEGGDLMKQYVSAAAPIIVTTDDCGTTNGLDFDIDDKELYGRVLAKDYGPIKAGTTVDKASLQSLRHLKINKVIARSPMTCQAKEGICSHCLGLLPEGHFARKGYAVGVTSAQAVLEPVVQNALGSKHVAGAFQGKKKVFSGFKVIEQLVQSPEAFPDKAAVSQVAGKVDKIEPAPQGGNIITVNGVDHYSLPGMDINVKPGQEVEAGDQLSDGIVDVADIVKTKGLGDARRYYVDRLQQALKESGAGSPTKKNLEVLARATINHVNVDEPDGLGDYLPDDTAEYSHLVSRYSPPKNAKTIPVEEANGKYLHAETLHHSIGTRLSPSMIKHIKDAGITHVMASDEEPQFTPIMVRLRAASHSGTNWASKLQGSYLTQNLAEDALRGRTTNFDSSTHFAPALMKGVNFGKDIETTGKF